MNSDASIRYRGHLSLCEIDMPGQQRIAGGRVLIIGVGGLGSPVALYLAAAGVGHITVLDPDTVSLSNLQRQVIHSTPDLGRPKAESARDAMAHINPTIEIIPVIDRITPDNAAGLIGSHDVTVDCTDNPLTRLLISDTCVSQGANYVFGAVRRFEGQAFTHTPGTASYRDIFGGEPSEEADIPCAIEGVLNTVVGIIGCIQATEVIKLLVGTGDLLTDRLLTFDAITMNFNTFRVR